MMEKKGKEYKKCLSKAGKDSAIQAFLKLSGYKGISPKKRKKKNINIILDDLSNLNDNLIIIKNYETSLDESMKKHLENEKQIKQTIPKRKEKINFYHNNQIQNNENDSKNDFGPPCTKYRPKYDLIYPKLIMGPHWNFISGRKYKKIEPDLKDFLITHDSIIDNEKKSLVNMHKDTQRGNIYSSDIRIRTDKKFDYKLNLKKRKEMARLFKNKQKENQSENKVKNKYDNLKLSISFSNAFKEEKQIEKKLDSASKKEDNTGKKETPFKTLKITNQSKLSKLSKEDSKEKSIGYIYPKKHMRTIDFDKILSREKREQALSKKKFVDIIRNPDHSPLYERTKIFKYHTLQNKSKIPQKIKCFNSYMNYNPNKAYKIRIVHPLDKVPNFNLILPRPNNNKILPSFMQKMFNRNAVYTMNDKNLILNEYSEQKLGKTMTSFFPKQSYNNIINMNIFTGNIFENDYNLEDVENKKEEMKFRLKIKNKNLGKLIKEGELKRFDNFSYRTFHKTKNIMVGDLNKYLFGLKEA